MVTDWIYAVQVDTRYEGADLVLVTTSLDEALQKVESLGATLADSSRYDLLECRIVWKADKRKVDHDAIWLTWWPTPKGSWS